MEVYYSYNVYVVVVCMCFELNYIIIDIIDVVKSSFIFIFLMNLVCLGDFFENVFCKIVMKF